MNRSGWTLKADVFKVVMTDPGKGLEFKVHGSNKTIYIEEALIDHDEPENIIYWLKGEHFKDLRLEYLTDKQNSSILITFKDIDDALRFKTSFGEHVTVKERNEAEA